MLQSAPPTRQSKTCNWWLVGFKPVFSLIFWDFSALQMFLILFFFARVKLGKFIKLKEWPGGGVSEGWGGISDIPLTHVRYTTDEWNSSLVDIFHIKNANCVCIHFFATVLKQMCLLHCINAPNACGWTGLLCGSRRDSSISDQTPIGLMESIYRQTSATSCTQVQHPVQPRRHLSRNTST